MKYLDSPCNNCEDRMRILEEHNFTRTCHSELCPHGWSEYQEMLDYHRREDAREYKSRCNYYDAKNTAIRYTINRYANKRKTK